MLPFWFQRLLPACGGTAQRKIFHLANWSQLLHPGPSSSRSRFLMESSQLYAATLTHYSTEPLTTRPDSEPLLLLLALAGDVHRNPGPSRYPCSVCFKTSLAKVPATCVQDVEALILPSINKFISPAKDQHSFRPRHSTTSALLQLTTDIETCFS